MAYAIDAGTGAILWTRDLGAQPTHLALYDGTLYSATKDALYAIDPKDSAVRWRRDGVHEFRAYGPDLERIRKNRGLLYVRANETEVSVSDQQTDTVQDTMSFHGAQIWDFVICDDVLYVSIPFQLKAVPLPT